MTKLLVDKNEEGAQGKNGNNNPADLNSGVSTGTRPYLHVTATHDRGFITDVMLISGGTGAEAPYGFHDWNFILSEMGLLLKYDTIANAVYTAGYVGMWLCVLWGGWSLFYYWFYQRKNLE